jgi:hypothetical protein
LKTLAHSASFDLAEQNAPPKSRSKQLGFSLHRVDKKAHNGGDDRARDATSSQLTGNVPNVKATASCHSRDQRTQ